MSLYKLNANVNWKDRQVDFLLTATGSVPPGAYVYLIDKDGHPLTNKKSIALNQETNYGKTTYSFYKDSNIAESWGLTGISDNNLGIITDGKLVSKSGQNLAKEDNYHIGKTIRFFRGNRTKDVALSSINEKSFNLGTLSEGLSVSAGDIIYLSGSDSYYACSGDQDWGPGEVAHINVDRNIIDSELYSSTSITILPKATITDYTYNSDNGTVDILFSELSPYKKSNVTGNYSYVDPSVTAGAGYVDIWINSDALYPAKEIRPGDYISLVSPNDAGTVEVLSVVSKSGFIIADPLFSDGNGHTGTITGHRVEEYGIVTGPKLGESMMAVAEDSSGSKIAMDFVYVSTPEIELNFNEYDSAVSSVGTLSHFHIGPLHVNGQVINKGVTNATAYLYANDNTLIDSWSVNYYDSFTSAKNNNGRYFNSGRGVFIGTSSRTFSQADMLTLSCTFTVNGQSLTKNTTIAALPVV